MATKKPAVEPLIRVGSLLSNVAFNYGQTAGPALDANGRATMRKLCSDWDNALRAYRLESKPKKRRHG